MASTVKQRENYLARIESNATEFVDLCNTKVCHAELPRKLAQAVASGRNLIHNVRELVEHVAMLDGLLKNLADGEVTS